MKHPDMKYILISYFLYLVFLVALVISVAALALRLGRASVVEAPAPVAETCWSGTLAVQMPEYADFWWVNYGTRNDNQVQICGVGLRVGSIQAFPDYSATIQALQQELEECRGRIVELEPAD